MTSRDTCTLLDLKAVSKHYQHHDLLTKALHEVNLTLAEGDFLVVRGPSGGGKSTLLSVMGLLEDLTSGDIFFKGRNVSLASEEEKARLRRDVFGFVFQSFNLVGQLSVLENVMLPLKLQGAAPADQRAKAMAMLERVDLSHRVSHFPDQLSGGQQQRVAIARAFGTNPSVVFADEPTGNLDSENGALVMRLLTEMHQAGSSVVLVTHEEKYEALGTHVVHMIDGVCAQAKFSSRRIFEHGR